MAQIIPPITTLPEGTLSAPSVEDIQDRLPSICVDYLSHNWTEEDVWASWRNMTRHKHEIANGVRLENASWRTWNKQRNKLRTISPETLNWLKDSDVTWLYGPLHTAAVEPVRPLKVATVDDRLGIDHPTGAKPGILKHRTLSELLTLPGHSSPVLEACIPEDEISHGGSDSKRPSISHTKSETSLGRSNSLPSRRRPKEDTLVSAMSRNAAHNNDEKERSPDSHPGMQKRHISFNTFVEQVVALDEPLVSPKPTFEEDSDDEMLEIRSHRSHRTSSVSSYGSTAMSVTISKVAPAMLKTAGSYTNNPNLPRMVYQPTAEYLSPQAEAAPPAVPSPFNMPSPVAKGPRYGNTAPGDDGYSGIGMDYFGGPDLTGSSPNANAGHLAGQFAARAAPAVQQPPVQPKWRQQVQTPDSNAPTGSSPSTTSSSSSSINNVAVSPQPGRSILKVRTPAVSVPVAEPVSPPAIFNYNPSVATGIGGMYGSYDEAKMAIATAPNEERGREHRGRTTSRGYGSSQNDRAVAVNLNARASSTSSSSSLSRSPVEAPAAVKAVRGRDQQAPAPAGTPAAPADQEAMDVDYQPERSSTPTPHSSPQIVLRPLKDTSPASLPHTSIGAAPERAASSTSKPASSSSSPSGATVAHAAVTAEPTLSQPPSSSQDGAVDDDDGSTLIGRATNIANTAKDLLGALWYGQPASDDGAGRPAPAARAHRRNASFG